MKAKSNHLKSILNSIAIVLVVPLFILTSQTSSLAVQPSVAAGGVHTVGVKSDGTVVAVGDNYNGGLNVDSWTDIVQVAAGGEHTVGVKSDGTVVAVGYNYAGQTNVGSWTDIVQVAAGSVHTVGLKSDRTVVAVGGYSSGSLGFVTDIVQVAAGLAHTVGLKSDGTVVAEGRDRYGQLNVGSWTDIVQVAAGADHTVGLKSDRTVVAVGYNSEGQLNVGSWTDIVQIAAGYYHTVGLKSDGTVVAVGRNDDGQLNVGSWTDIVQVAAGGEHSVGVKSDGTVVAVGNNGVGQCNVFDWDLMVEEKNPIAEIIGTWSGGIWYWDVAASQWTQMSSGTPDGDITAGDFTGDGKADVASIWSSGLWYQDGATLGWTKVSDSAPDSVTAGDVTGDGRFEIIGTWSNGIWYWDESETKWTKMAASTPTGDIAAGDFTGDGKADVASCWNNGLWYQDGATLSWTKVSNTAPDSVTAGDVTGDGRFEIIGTWDSGIWYWDVAASKYTKMSSDTTTEDIAAGDFTGDGKADVAGIFASGLWYLDGATFDLTKVTGRAPDRLTAGDVTGPLRVPLNLFNIGNSIGEGIAANGVIGSIHHEAVWSTGFDTGDSVYTLNERFEDVDPTGYYENDATRDNIFNQAVEGNKMEDFKTQASAVVADAGETPSRSVGMVAVFLGNNDVCTDEVGTMTDLGLFEDQYRAGLTFLAESAVTKNAVIHVSGIPDIYWLWIAKRDSFWCRGFAWPLVPCQELLANPSNDCGSGNSDLVPDTIYPDDGPNCIRRKDFHAAIRDDYNRILRDVLMEYKDGGLLPNAYYVDIFDIQFGTEHVNDGDCFHPSVEGHERFAAEHWCRSPWGMDDPNCMP